MIALNEAKLLSFSYFFQFLEGNSLQNQINHYLHTSDGFSAFKQLYKEEVW